MASGSSLERVRSTGGSGAPRAASDVAVLMPFVNIALKTVLQKDMGTVLQIISIFGSHLVRMTRRSPLPPTERSSWISPTGSLGVWVGCVVDSDAGRAGITKGAMLFTLAISKSRRSISRLEGVYLWYARCWCTMSHYIDKELL
jgi:hypothetical protein